MCEVNFAQTLVQENDLLYQQTMSTHAHVVKHQNFTSNLLVDSSASLPIGIYKTIGNTSYIIAIDSAKFLPNEARLSAFMAIGLPGMPDSLAFAAKNIGFNPSGVLSETMANSRLVLVSKHVIRMGPKVNLVLENDGSNYIEWNCNGFQSINLKGNFVFSNSFLESENSVDSTVKATFEIHANDLNNMIMMVNISPFKIKGIDDLSFTVNEAIADFSEFQNPASMVFPVGYQNNSSNPFLWKGFYLKNVTVKLPQEISPKNQNRTSITVNNLIIDNSGVTGLIGVNNILSLENSDLAKWKFSINQLQIGIVQNHINSGYISGNLKLPVFENNSITYSASVYQNPTTKQTDYLFSVGPQNNILIDVVAAKIDIHPSSQFSILKSSNKFIPTASLTGKIQFVNNKIETSKLDFQNLVIEKDAPYISSGIFNYTGNSSSKAISFPVSITQIQLSVLQGKPSVHFNLHVNLMNAVDQGFASDFGISILTKTVVAGSEPGNTRLAFDRFDVSSIQLNVQTMSFQLNGLIAHFDNHPIYGNGFSGSIGLVIPEPELMVNFNSVFGAKTTYKYFYVDGTANLAGDVTITPHIKLKKIMGGFYYHMNKPIDYVMSLQPNYIPATGSNAYVPDSTKSIGFKAGVTIFYAKDEALVNGDLALEILFNNQQNGGGIAMVQLSGDAFSMISILKRTGKRYNQVPVGANASIVYDFNNETLHAVLNVGINLEGVNGVINSCFHFEPGTWYIAIGKPSLKGNVTVVNFATISGYFMTGNSIEPASPLPSQIAQHFGNPNNRNTTALNDGLAVCMGAAYSGGAGGEYGFSFFSVYGNVNFIIGFDMMMQKVNDNYLCASTGKSPGFDGNYISGNLYAYFNAQVGVRGEVEISGVSKSFDIEIFNATAAALLTGELIKPTYVEGNIYASYNILKTFSGSFTYNFKKGTKCSG
ncbi:MAG: hypothetical protein JNM96_09320 [Bacteroidia bacterium]|nr:hypothetical protein [Bacteroidia bacterium]